MSKERAFNEFERERIKDTLLSIRTFYLLTAILFVVLSFAFYYNISILYPTFGIVFYLFITAQISDEVLFFFNTHKIYLHRSIASSLSFSYLFYFSFEQSNIYVLIFSGILGIFSISNYFYNRFLVKNQSIEILLGHLRLEKNETED